MVDLGDPALGGFSPHVGGNVWILLMSDAVGLPLAVYLQFLMFAWLQGMMLLKYSAFL